MTEDLTTLRGVGPKIAEALEAAGFETPDEVLEADVDELTEAEHVGESTAKAILNEETSGYKGRPSKLDDHWGDIMAAAAEGLTMEGIARVAGVGVSTLNDWRRENEEFAEALRRNRAKGERELIQDADAEFILERSYGYTKEQEIDLSGGEEIGGLTPEDKEQLNELFDVDPQEDA